MTKDELIQKAIECLKENKVTKEMLSEAHVRERTVAYVWFKMRGHSNCQIMFDTQTGELLGRLFSPDAFLPEYVSHCRLPKEADRLAGQVRDGVWNRFPELGTEPAPVYQELINELEKFCPGLAPADYEQALAASLSKLAITNVK
jgi:hypothetical protein